MKETVTTFIQSTSYLSSIRRQTYRVLLDALALRPSLIMSSKHAAALQFEEEANAGLLARLEDRKKIYDAITRMPVDAAEWLEILADDPSHWPFVLSIEPFDQIQDENAATQSKFWNLVLRSDDALEHAVYYLLDNSPDQLTSSPTSPQLLDFIKCAALNANGGTLPHMDLLNLQSIIVAAAVALHSRTTESHLFWQGLMDETTSLVSFAALCARKSVRI